MSTDNEDQFTVRFDQKITSRQNFSAYYYFNDIRQLQPYNDFEAAGATVPGFGNFNNNRYQQWNLTHTWTITNALVNEAHFNYMREGQLGFLKPQTTMLVTSSCTGAASPFALPASRILPRSKPACLFWHRARQRRNHSRFALDPHWGSLRQYRWRRRIGNNFEGFLPQVGNSFQWSDNLTWVKGNHTFKFGVDIRRARFDQYYYFDVNGEFTFNNSGPNAIIPGDGDNYAEFLLG